MTVAIVPLHSMMALICGTRFAAMKAGIVIWAFQAAILSQLVSEQEQTVSEVQRPDGSVTFRYSRQRIVSCEVNRFLYFRHRPKCKVEHRGVPGTAKIELQPLPDARREIFGRDKRSRIVLDLAQNDQPTERSLKLMPGPWQVIWKGTDKATRLDVETQDQTVALSTLIGTCLSKEWRCKLDPSTITNTIVISGPGKRTK